MKNKDSSFYDFVANHYPEDEEQIDWNLYDKRLSHLVDQYVERKVAYTIQYSENLKCYDKNMANVNIQHNAHNSLDNLNDKLYQLDQWKVQQGTFPYILAEYLRTHIKEMRETVNQYYLLLKSS